MPPSSVHFNGSVNLPDAETVMREISSRIPAGVRRMTDGETGDRNYWISFQTRKFEQMPEFETVASGRAYETDRDAPDMPRLRLVEGASADTIDWPDLGYAEEYTKSFATFDALQQQGTIPAGVRLQLQYPTPLASMAGTIAPEDLPAVAPAYEQALFADLDTLLDRLPHDRIAVQWDIAVEMGALEGAMGVTMPMEQIAPGIVRCLERVPADVPAGLHLCYGDYGHEHWMQPASLQMQVDLVNAVTSSTQRRLDFSRSPCRRTATTAPTSSPSAGWDRRGHRAELRGRPLPPGRPGCGHDRPADRAHRRGPRRLGRRRARVGDLHRVRDGARRRTRRARPARPAQPDPGLVALNGRVRGRDRRQRRSSPSVPRRAARPPGRGRVARRPARPVSRPPASRDGGV